MRRDRLESDKNSSWNLVARCAHSPHHESATDAASVVFHKAVFRRSGRARTANGVNFCRPRFEQARLRSNKLADTPLCARSAKESYKLAACSLAVQRSFSRRSSVRTIFGRIAAWTLNVVEVRAESLLVSVEIAENLQRQKQFELIDS